MFISFSSADARQYCGRSSFYVVQELKRALESHRHPDDGRRFRACTFNEDFHLEPSLPEAIQNAIDNSEGMVVVAGSGAAVSPYVALEVNYAVSIRAMGFDLVAARLNEDASVLWPDAFSAIDLNLDLTCPQTGTTSAWRERVVAESHKLVARIWELPLNEVHDRHATQARLARRRLFASICGVIMLLTSVGTAGVLAWIDGERSEASRLGQSALTAARVSCFDSRGLVDGIKGISHIPAWRGGAPSAATYGLHSLMNRARRELMVQCDGVQAAIFTEIDNDGVFVQCAAAEKWHVSHDWPPVRVRVPKPEKDASRDQEYQGPVVTGADWEIRAIPGASITVEHKGQPVQTIAVSSRVWRLAADGSGKQVAWLEEDNVLRAWKQGGPVRIVASDVPHTTALLVTAAGDAIIASSPPVSGTFNDNVVRWTWSDEAANWEQVGVLYPYGGPIQDISEATSAGIFSIATDHNGIHLWDGSHDVPLAHLSCPQRVAVSTSVSADGETVAAGWADTFATRWQRNATRADVLASGVSEALSSSMQVAFVTGNNVRRINSERSVQLSSRDARIVIRGNLVIAGVDGKLFLDDGKVTHSIPLNVVLMAVHPSESIIFVKGTDNDDPFLAAMDFDGTEIWRITEKADLVVVSKDGTRVYIGREKEIIALKANSGNESWRWSGVENIQEILDAPDGLSILVQSSFGDRTALFADSGAVRWEIDLPNETQMNAAFIDADTVVTGSWDGRIEVYELPSRKPAWTVPIAATGTHRLAISHDGKSIAIDAFGDVHVVDVDSRALSARFQIPGRWAEKLFFGPEGNIFTVTEQGELLRFHHNQAALLKEACELSVLYNTVREEVEEHCKSEEGANHSTKSDK